MSHNNQKKIAVINDFSGFGRCSIAVALPIISTLKIQCCPLPTSIFSNHTGFDSFFFDDYTDKMPLYINEWKKLGLQFDGITSGFLGSKKQIEIVTQFFKDFKTKENIIIVDPVMGDYGKIYATYTKEMCEEMKKLVQYADIITPNITELCILTDTPYQEKWKISELEKMTEELAEKDSTTAEQNLHDLHLLLAEDNPLNQELCLELLKSRGISSDCAVNGKEALELFTNSAPGTYALILMDIQMPVLDGYQTTQAIRSSMHPQAQTIPIISLSADAFTEDIRRAYASGMNDHVSKPIVPEELFAAITRVLKTLN